MKKILRTLVSLAVVLAMLSGIGIFAAAEAEDKLVYTCLGDSNAAGYGLEDWHENRVEVKGSYHSIIAKEMGYELKPFGSGGYRTDEMLYLFDEPTFEMDWAYSVIAPTNITKEFMDTYKEAYVQAVKDADIITLQLGANEVVGDAMGFPVTDFYKPVEKFESLKAMFNGEDEISKLMLEAISTIETVYKGAKMLVDMYKNIQTTYAEFPDKWDKVIENIYKLNPDVDLYVLSAVNSFNNVSLLEGSPVAGCRIFDICVAKLNNWIAYGSEYADTYAFIDVTDQEYARLSLTQDDFWKVYLPIVHPLPHQYAEIADRVIDVIKTGKHTTETPAEVAFGKAWAKVLWK